MTADEIAKLEALLEKATPGPWGFGVPTRAFPERDRCLTTQDEDMIVAAVNALPSLLSDARLLAEARESGALKRGAEHLDYWSEMEDAALLRRLHSGAAHEREA
jgi:hypothetical protein